MAYRTPTTGPVSNIERRPTSLNAGHSNFSEAVDMNTPPKQLLEHRGDAKFKRSVENRTKRAIQYRIQKNKDRRDI